MQLLIKNIKYFIKNSIIYRNIKSRRLRNIYKKAYRKRALLSYMVMPFRGSEKHSYHSNRQESRVIAKILDSANYIVDVYDWSYSRPIPYEEYDLIIGQGYPLENSFYQSFNGTKIYLATGASTQQRNYAELRRLKALRDRKGKLLKPKRIKSYPDYASSVLSDAIFCTGNQFTINTYRSVYDGNIFRIPVSVVATVISEKINRNISKARNHFLWIGSNGLVHKGLDLCIEAFKQMKDCHLHICGPKEEEFFETYEDAFQKYNITYHGFVDTNSKLYKKIVEKCMFSIFPSCSEGGGGSVLSAMKSGLIPVVTREASVDIDNFGFLIESPEIDCIKKTIKNVSTLSTNELEDRSRSSKEFVDNQHSIDSYFSAFSNALEAVLSQH